MHHLDLRSKGPSCSDNTDCSGRLRLSAGIKGNAYSFVWDLVCTEGEVFLDDGACSPLARTALPPPATESKKENLLYFEKLHTAVP